MDASSAFKDTLPTTPEALVETLENAGIAFTRHEHPPLRTVEESKGHRSDMVGTHVKNLYLRDRKKRNFLVVAQEDREIDLKALQDKIGADRLSFGSADRLFEFLGVRPGADTALGPAERRKYGDYEAPRDRTTGELLAQPVTMVPLAFDTYGRWGEAAADALKRWARRRLTRPDAARSVRRAGLFQQVLARWRAAGSCPLQRGNFEAFAACVGMNAGPEATEELLVGPVPYVRYLTDRATMAAG